tara:strand:- start:421 stop:615 length:195 start_codon:yes stop_codon:yes gene_type:complete
MKNGNSSVNHVWNYYDQNLILISTEAHGSERKRNNLFKFFFDKKMFSVGLKPLKKCFRISRVSR